MLIYTSLTQVRTVDVIIALVCWLWLLEFTNISTLKKLFWSFNDKTTQTCT